MGFEDTDLMSPAVHTTDCEPFYEWLREERPLYWDRGSELWAVSRYEDVIDVSRNTSVFCSGYGVVPKVSPEDWPDEAMINLDGAAHSCQRALVSKGFSPRRVADLEDYVREVVIELIEGVREKCHGDLVEDMARPLPMRIIGKMLGYPLAKQDEVLGWTDVYTHAGCGPDHITGDVIEAFGQFTEYHQELMEERRSCPGEDLLSVWLTAELEGNRLSEEKLLFEHNLLLVGGSETTRNAISVGMHQLMLRPEQYQYLKASPEGIPNAVEEMLRWSTPFVRMARTLTCDYEMHGLQMKKGQQIIMLYPAANRDPRVFDEPQRFDVRREMNRPVLSFGFGRHFCLGASLARLEMRIFLEEILTRLPAMKLRSDSEPVKSVSCFIRGYRSLPVSYS